MIANPDKFQVIFLGVPNPTNIFVNINNVKIYGKTEVELLGITLDYNLSFKSHVKKLCLNANKKNSALIRFRNMLTFEQTSQTWNNLPNLYKLSESLNIFKNKIKQWDRNECHYHICK